METSFVRAVEELSQKGGLDDPDRVQLVRSGLVGLFALRESQELLPDLFERLVRGLPLTVSTSARNRTIFLEAINCFLRPDWSRTRRILEIESRPGWVIPRSAKAHREIIAHVATALESHYELDTASAGRRTGDNQGTWSQQHRLEDLFVDLDVPEPFRGPRDVHEQRVVRPLRAQMNEWRGELTLYDRPVPEISHHGAGRLIETRLSANSETALTIRVAFDPPAFSSQTFGLRARLENVSALPPTDFSFYRYRFRRKPRALHITARFGARPSAAYWVQTELDSDFPLYPDVCVHEPIIETDDGWVVHVERSGDDVQQTAAGLVWFWTEVSYDEGMLSYELAHA